MSLALESVCKTLGLKVIDDPATRHVAEKIIELSQHGVRANDAAANLGPPPAQKLRVSRVPTDFQKPE